MLLLKLGGNRKRSRSMSNTTHVKCDMQSLIAGAFSLSGNFLCVCECVITPAVCKSILTSLGGSAEL